MSGVTIKNLSVAYGDMRVFDDFNAEFEDGKISVVLGGSGVGKTTLLNAVAGLCEYSGEINGTQEGLSFIFQKDRLIPSISVYKNLDLVLRAKITDKQERREKIENMLNLLEVYGQIKKLPVELSGGQIQRVAMARAFLYPASVLLMDEPFKALDTALKSRLLEQFVELNEKEKKTVIFVTHAIDECLLTADRFIVLGGSPAKIVESGEIISDKKERKLTDNESAKVRLKLLDALCN